MELFTCWLALKATLITVTVPFLLLVSYSVYLCWAPVELRNQALKLIAYTLILAPLSIIVSPWDDGGLHTIPVFLLPVFWMMIYRGLQVRRHLVSLVLVYWVGVMIPDIWGAWVEYGASGMHDETAATWYWGIGGYGVDDALFLGPVMMPLTLLVVQEGLRRRWFRPTTWIDAMRFR